MYRYSYRYWAVATGSENVNYYDGSFHKKFPLEIVDAGQNFIELENISIPNKKRYVWAALTAELFMMNKVMHSKHELIEKASQ